MKLFGLEIYGCLLGSALWLWHIQINITLQIRSSSAFYGDLIMIHREYSDPIRKSNDQLQPVILIKYNAPLSEPFCPSMGVPFRESYSVH